MRGLATWSRMNVWLGWRSTNSTTVEFTSARLVARFIAHQIAATTGARSASTFRQYSQLKFKHFLSLMVRVILPYHLRNLAQIGQEVSLEVTAPVCIRAILDAVEATYPVLKGTIREHETHKRRAFLRFFACGEDISLDPIEDQLPDSIAEGKEPFMVVGAIAGG